MVKLLGYVVGLFLVSEGATASTSPQTWSQMATRFAEDYLPDPIRETTLELTRLSPSAIRFLGVWEAVIGLLMLRLAKRARW